MVALGGNAITPTGGTGTAEEQERTVAAAMARLAPMVASGAELVITHGNGPQIGNLMLKNEVAAHLVPPMPLDWCVAQTQATIGLAIQTALEWELRRLGVERGVVAVLTRVVVDGDPAAMAWTKPIGRHLAEADARAASDSRHRFAPQADGSWRRVVPSPEPLAVVEEPQIRRLLESRAVVVAAGGGGVPVHEDAEGRYRGVEVVIDKDLTASLLARSLRADTLVILTDTEGATLDFGRPGQRVLGQIGAAGLRELQARGHFGAGSMGPKVEAALRFVEAGGARAVIASLDRAVEAVAGSAGTQIAGPGAVPV